MRRAPRLVLLALALLVVPAADALESTSSLGPVEATVDLTPDAPVIGDALVLKIEALAEDGVEVLMPEFGEALERFTIVDFVPRETLEDDGRTRHSQRYTLRPPGSGRYVLPALLIEFVDRRPGRDPAPEGLDAYELLSDPIPFEIESVVPDAATAELAPPMGELGPRGAGRGELLAWIGAGLVALLAALPFAWRAWQQRRERESARSAYELARGALDDLLAKPRPSDADEIDAFFVELSGIVRRYLENRFALRSPELTTERFLEVVSQSPDLSEEQQVLLRDFLRQADLVKFAHYVPPPEAIEESIRAVGEFIEETREGPEVEPEPPTSPAPPDAGPPAGDDGGPPRFFADVGSGEQTLEEVRRP